MLFVENTGLSMLMSTLQQKSEVDRGKKDIKTVDDSPFSVLFEYGASGDGYWTYDHMVLQLEDVVDVLDTIYSVPWDGCDSPHNVFVKSATQPKTLVRKFEYLFLTDHSCGHDRKRHRCVAKRIYNPDEFCT